MFLFTNFGTDHAGPRLRHAAIRSYFSTEKNSTGEPTRRSLTADCSVG
jgi:hypothetical protein